MNWIEQRLYKRYALTENKRWLWLYHVITFGPVIGWGISGVIAVVTESVKEWFVLTLILMLVVALGMIVFLTRTIMNDKKREWVRESNRKD